MAEKKAKKRAVRNDNRDEHVRRAMFGRAGGRCMKPECRDPVSYTEPGTGRVRTTGEIAHVYGVKPKAERYVKDMKPAERDRLENLLVVCPTCHDIIDKPGAHVAFPATKLLKWHQDRELELNRTAGRSPARFGFQELQRVVRLLPAVRWDGPPSSRSHPANCEGAERRVRIHMGAVRPPSGHSAEKTHLLVSRNRHGRSFSVIPKLHGTL